MTPHLQLYELKRLIADPIIQEALFIASRSVFDHTRRWLSGGDAHPKLVITLMKYLQRMSRRATPFGLFSGCSVGQIGGTTAIFLPTMTANRRYARLDNGQLDAIACDLAARPEIRSRATIFPNSSLYRAAHGYRYVITAHEKGRQLRTLAFLERNQFVDIVLDSCAGGTHMSTLTAAVTLADTDAQIDTADAVLFINDLLDRQVLVSSIDVSLTGPEPLDQLIAALGDCGDVASAAVAALTSIRVQLHSLNGVPIGVDPSSYGHIAREISGICRGSVEEHIIQVDLVKPAISATLGPRELDTLQLAIRTMHTVCAPSPDNDLAAFRDRFAARYGYRDVPLLEALDDDAGIGFGARPADHSSLLQDLTPIDISDVQATVGPRERALLRLIGRAYRDRARVIELTDGDLESLRSPGSLPLPKALYVLASLAHSTQGDGIEVFIRSISGPSGANMLGRFCHADSDLHRYVIRHLEQEERGARALFAEIVHAPEGRLVNVVARPILRTYEIPYLGTSGAPQCRQLCLTDLSVRVRNDRVIITSATLQREILPRMTTMHNYRLGPPVYRFLCAVQRQGVQAHLSWNWGVFETLDWLPRVLYRNIILSRAQWRLDGQHIQRLCAGSVDERYSVFYRWVSTNELPHRLLLRDADHELPVDVNNGLSVDSFLSAIRGRSEAYVVEDWPEPSRLLVKGVDGCFTNEVVVPFVSETMPTDSSASRYSYSGVADLSHKPGGEWLYVKYYIGRTAADDLVTRVLAPMLDRLITQGIVREWFFLRYADPDWHIRLRLRGWSASTLWREALPVVTGAEAGDFHSGVVWKIQLDTYDPELDRYGGPEALPLSEELFHVDSQAAVRILSELRDGHQVDDRWRVCLCSWDLLLNAFGLELEDRVSCVSHGRTQLERQLTHRRLHRRMLSDRFRRERRSLAEILRGSPAGALGACVKALKVRDAMLQPLIKRLKELASTGRLSVDLHELVRSHLHMNANRLLRSRHLDHEFVLYDLLTRFYMSERATSGLLPGHR